MDIPKLFIASSKERLEVARTAQELLADAASTRVWDQGFFGLSKTVKEVLLQALDSYDAAVFILGPDDVATMRGQSVNVARDNVIFELGMFWGRLGPKRTFIFVPGDPVSLHLPTDLAGVITAQYDAQAKGEELFSSLGPACNPIRRALRASLEQEASSTLQNFLETTNFDEVSRICVIAYTGSSTLRTIYEYLDREAGEAKSEIKLQVALRSPFLSDAQRAGDIRRSLDLLDTLARNKRWIKPEVRFYGAPALLRSVLIDNRDRTHSAYLSYYDWNRAESAIRRATANQRASHTLCDLTSRRLEEVHRSWFAHYWSTHSIHTIIFDFDDTLFETSHVRIGAWRETIEEAVHREMGEGTFTAEINKVLRTSSLSVVLREIFFDEQDDAQIAARIFRNPGARSLDWAQVFRMKRRAELTYEQAQPMHGLADCLQALGSDFQLGIVTGTDESSVKRVLEKHHLLDRFCFVLGREAPKQPWASVEVKTENLLRAATVLGVPLDRIVFIGDDDADYNSAKQLGMHFIENCAVALANGRVTLIRSKTPRCSISGFTGGALRRAVEAIPQE